MNKLAKALQVLSILWTLIPGSVTQASELRFPVERPHYSEEAHRRFLEYRSTNPTGYLTREKCPLFNQVIENLIDRIAFANGLEDYLTKSPGLPVEVLCESAGIMETGLTTQGTLVIPAGMVGYLEDEDQLAFVLAHEISHFLLAHDEQRLMSLIDEKMIDRKAAERDADLLGTELIKNAGFDPYAGVDVMNSLRSVLVQCHVGILCIEEKSSGHPTTGERKRSLLNANRKKRLFSKVRQKSKLFIQAQSEWRLSHAQGSQSSKNPG